VLTSRIKHFLSGQTNQQDVGAPAGMTEATKAVIATESAVTRPLGAAIDLATELMQAHGLMGWRIKLDHARRRAGQCDYSTKTISLSRLYVRHADADHIRDTILHEIAHALVGPNHGHDVVWRQKAREIGGTASRCHTLSFSRARWQMRCPNGCFAVERHRRKSGLICASCKAAVEFHPAENAGVL
jgi:predicted SprT family Zn-dependent metalloprotease